MPRSLPILLIAALALAASQRAVAAEPTPMPSWIVWQAEKKQVEITLKAAYNGNNGSWNWNGYYEGGATVVVPEGASLLVHFINPDGNYPHSLVVTEAYAADEMPEQAGREEAAIARAYTRSPTGGCQACEEDLRFKAKAAGDYYFFCGVTGHGLAGMWIGFEISAAAEAPRLKVAEDALDADDQPPWQ